MLLSRLACSRRLGRFFFAQGNKDQAPAGPACDLLCRWQRTPDTTRCAARFPALPRFARSRRGPELLRRPRRLRAPVLCGPGSRPDGPVSPPGGGPAPQPVPSCALPIKKRPAGRLTPYERGSTPRGRNLFEGVYHTRMEKYSFFCRIPASGGKEGNPACSIRRNRLGTAASGEEQSFFI